MNGTMIESGVMISATLVLEMIIFTDSLVIDLYIFSMKDELAALKYEETDSLCRILNMIEMTEIIILMMGVMHNVFLKQDLPE